MTDDQSETSESEDMSSHKPPCPSRGREHKWSDEGFCYICNVDCEHLVVEDGECMECGFECRHDWSDGVCLKCQKKCKHEYYPSDTCEICGRECNHMVDEVLLQGTFERSAFVEGVCSECNYECDHEHGTRKQHGEYECEMCGEDIEHNYSDYDGVCKECDVRCPHDFILERCMDCGFICTHTRHVDEANRCNQCANR